MSTREERILELAREAWQKGEPRQARVELAARRIERNLRASTRRTRPARRHTLVLAFLVVFVGALAYAASGGSRGLFSEGSKGTNSKIASAARTGLGAGVIESVQRTKPRADTEARSASPAPVEQREAKPSTARAGTPAPAASWRAVDEALDAKDDARASRALEGLAKSSDATTRAKARLGLAQLAKSKGDCPTAKRLAAEVAAMSDVEPSVQKRAASLAGECE